MNGILFIVLVIFLSSLVHVGYCQFEDNYYNTDTTDIACVERNDSIELIINVSEIVKFEFNCSCCKKSKIFNSVRNFSIENFLNNSTFSSKGGLFAQRIIVIDQKVLLPLGNKYFSPRFLNSKTQRPLFYSCPFYSNCLVMYNSLPNDIDHFYLDAQSIGKTKLLISVIWWNVTRLPMNVREFYLDDESFERKKIEEQKIISQSKYQNVLLEFQCNVTVLRKPNVCNSAFNLSSAFIAALLALSVGCSLEISSVRSYLTRPKCILLGLMSQYIILPALSIAISKLLKLKDALGYGLVALSCTPGGGLGHIIVFLMKGDENLSGLLSALNSLLNSGLSLLWMYGINGFYDVQFFPQYMAFWLGIIPIVQSVGIVINYFSISAAQAIMTWFTRPLLLLAGILFVTLGVYINNYAFSPINQSMMLALILLILCGFLIGSICGYLSSNNHSKDVTCSLSVETAFSNALILIPALRYSLYQPDADIASSVCLWSIFFSPLPLFLIYLSKKVQKFIMNFVKNQFKRKTNSRRVGSSVKSTISNRENDSTVKSDESHQIVYREDYF